MRYLPLTAFLAICLLSFVAYSNSFNTPYHYDDSTNIIRNKNVHMTEFNWDSVKKSWFAGGERGVIYHPILYRPVPMFSLALNYFIAEGLNPFGFHIVNFSVHLIAILFLFLFIADVLKLVKYEGNPHIIAFIATALWAVNPVQLTSVTYLTQRMTSMAGMFYIMTLFLYLRARTGRKLKLAGLSVLTAILAILSKENAVMVFASITIFDIIFFEHKNLKRDLAIIAGFAILTGLLAIALQGWETFSFKTLQEGYAKREWTLGQRLLTEPRVIVFYLILLLFPVNSMLSLTHNVPVSTGLLSPPETLFAMVIIGCLISLAIVARKRYPIFSFAVFFFFLNHLIEGSIFPIELVYEHRNYVPSMFLFLPLVIPAMRYRKILAVVTASVLILFTVNTYKQNEIWKTDLALWQDTIKKSPDPRSMFNLGGAYYTIYKDEPEHEKKYLDKAMKYFAVSKNFNTLFGTNYEQNFKKIPYGRVMFMADHNLRMLEMVKDKKARHGIAVDSNFMKDAIIKEPEGG